MIISEEPAVPPRDENWKLFDESLRERLATIEWRPFCHVKIVKHEGYWVMIYRHLFTPAFTWHVSERHEDVLHTAVTQAIPGLREFYAPMFGRVQ